MTIGNVLLFVLFLLAFLFFGRMIIVQLLKLRFAIKNNKTYEQKIKEVEEMKARGEMHDWISTPIYGYICKKTGYCPSVEGFVPMEIVGMIVKKIEIEEKFEKFRDEEMEKLVKKYSLSKQTLEEIAVDIFSIKKDFTVEQLGDLLDNLKSQESIKE